MLVMAKRRKKAAGPSPWPARLTKLQEALDLKPPAMAERLGISFNTYRSWLYGRRLPSGAAVKLLTLRIDESKK